MQRLSQVAELRDLRAFGQLFDHFAPRVHRFLMRKGANSGDAEDLAQETMITVWSKAPLFASNRGSVATWIFVIARNLRIDKLRREKPNLFSDIGDYDAPSEDASAEESVSRMQEDSLVSRALNNIPEEQRLILILSYVEDIPHSQIAIQLRIPLGTVKSRVRLAYGHMQKLLRR